MRSRHTPSAGFPLLLCGIAIAGLMSALIDGTVGWEHLAHAVWMSALQ